MTRIYLDYNATAPIFPEVIHLTGELMTAPHNASSVHALGREGRKIVEQAREKTSELCGVQANQVIFNSGATEGNNTVLQHFSGQRVLVSSTDHKAVLDVLPGAVHIPVGTDGLVDLHALEELLKQEPTALVSVMAVNNETGVIQPMAEISALAHKYGALYHCDAVQAAGKIPLNMAELGIDFMTLSAHKIGGPQGVGALVFGFCGQTPVLLHGGGQEKSARAGTENVAGIAGFGLACEIARKNLPQYQKLEELRDRLENNLKEISPNITIYGQNVARAPNTSMFALPGITSERLLIALDLQGFALSNGSACSSGTVQPSHVLTAMGANDKDAASALRLSMGWNTKPEEIDAFLSAWKDITSRLH